MSAQHTQGRLTLQLIEGWPFGVKLLDQFGNVVLHANAPCQSSEQKTRNDHELGIGFKINAKPGWRREDAAASVAAQTAFYRRLVACWNACEGIHTDYMEHIVREGGSIDAEVKKRISDFVSMKAQRDELLAALEKARAGLSNGLWDYGQDQDEHEQCDALIAEIDAAIAKTGGTS